MTGEQLREKLIKWGIVQAHAAEKMGMSPQAFESKLATKDPKLGFIIALAKAINKNVYEIIGVPAPPSGSHGIIVSEDIAVYNDDHLIKMAVMDMQFAAGASSYTPDYIEASDQVHIPKAWLKKGKTFACGRIRGDSMAPTLLDGGYGIIRKLSKAEWGNMPNEEIYVVVSKDNQFANVQVKRVKNRFSQGFIVMMSDNPDKASNPNFNIYHDEIVSIWHMDWYFTSRMPNIHNQYYSRLQALEDKVEDLVNELKPTIRSK